MKRNEVGSTEGRISSSSRASRGMASMGTLLGSEGSSSISSGDKVDF